MGNDDTNFFLHSPENYTFFTFTREKEESHLKLHKATQKAVYRHGQCVSYLRGDTYRRVMFRNLYHEMTLP